MPHTSHFDVGKAGVADRFKEALGSVNYYDQRHLCSPTLLIKRTALKKKGYYFSFLVREKAVTQLIS